APAAGGALRQAYDLADAALERTAGDRPLDSDLSAAQGVLPGIAALAPWPTAGGPALPEAASRNWADSLRGPAWTRAPHTRERSRGRVPRGAAAALPCTCRCCQRR